MPDVCDKFRKTYRKLKIGRIWSSVEDEEQLRLVYWKIDSDHNRVVQLTHLPCDDFKNVYFIFLSSSNHKSEPLSVD